MSVLAVAFDLKWMTAVLAYGFVARVLIGPTLSPLGQLVTRVATPRLGVAAVLESAFAICLGCITFGMLMRTGVVPHEVCARCNDIWGDNAPASSVAA